MSVLRKFSNYINHRSHTMSAPCAAALSGCCAACARNEISNLPPLISVKGVGLCIPRRHRRRLQAHLVIMGLAAAAAGKRKTAAVSYTGAGDDDDDDEYEHDDNDEEEEYKCVRDDQTRSHSTAPC